MSIGHAAIAELAIAGLSAPADKPRKRTTTASPDEQMRARGDALTTARRDATLVPELR